MNTDRRRRPSWSCLIIPLVAAACGNVPNPAHDGGPTGDGSPATRTITVQRGHGGGGAVTSTPGGISCGSACTASVLDGTAMVLTAAPDAGSVFAGWSGPCTGTSLTCSFTVSGDVTVGAAFDVQHYTVMVTPAGTGAGTVTGTPGGLSCPGACTISVVAGAQITLTAAAQSSSRFVGWGGSACSGIAPCVMTVNADQAVTATFVPTSCGNGVLESGEQCDDGNADNGDGCTSACQNARCGDAFTWRGHEDCDDGNINPNDACTNTCRVAVCGDGITWSGHEDCDDGNTSNSDACNNSCHCGGVGEPCCAAGSACDTGTGCLANTCTTCPAPPQTTTRLFVPLDSDGSNCTGVNNLHLYSARCADGNHREACVTNVLSTPGGASCAFDSWANPNDPDDCSCNVRYIVNAVPFDCARRISCSVTITQTTDPQPHPDGCP